VIEAATRISFLERKSLSISLDPEMDIFVSDPLAVLIHHASFEHRGGALPMQIDPAWYTGFGHAVAPADVFCHLSRKAMTNRLELPAMPARLGPLIHPANRHRRD
jgi:hypothetical protein